MTETEVREMRRNLDEQYKKDRETLDRMLDLILRSNGSNKRGSESSESVRSMTINERIANHIFQMDGNFTMQDAWKFIKEKDPEFGATLNRQAMSTAIWKLNKSKDIKIIIPKKGKSAAIYSKTPPSAPSLSARPPSCAAGRSTKSSTWP